MVCYLIGSGNFRLRLIIGSLKCCVSAHWGCMAQTQRDEVVRAIRRREIAEWEAKHGEEEDMPSKRKELEIHEMTDFICGQYIVWGIYINKQSSSMF